MNNLNKNKKILKWQVLSRNHLREEEEERNWRKEEINLIGHWRIFAMIMLLNRDNMMISSHNKNNNNNRYLMKCKQCSMPSRNLWVDSLRRFLRETTILLSDIEELLKIRRRWQQRLSLIIGNNSNFNSSQVYKSSKLKCCHLFLN